MIRFLKERRLRDRPLREKVSLLIVLASAGGLALAALAVLIYEITTYRPRLRRDALTQAEIVRVNTLPALAFGDSVAATEDLATLEYRTDVLAAAVYRPGGALFAAYLRPGAGPSALPAPPTEPGTVRHGGRIVVAQSLDSEGQRIGWLVLAYQVPPLWARLPQYTIMVAVVLLALVSTGVVLTRTLRRSVSAPILDLADTARRITATRDYDVRVPQRSLDEIGALTGAFNDMLAAIEEREGALQQSEARLRLALDAASLRTWAIQLDRRGAAANGRIVDQLGQILGDAPDDDRAAVGRAIAYALESGGSFDVEFRTGPPAEQRWMALSGQAVHGLGGAPDQLLGVVQDITERRRLELQLIQAQKMEAIGNLAGGIAHDFNNLLTGILGYLAFVQRALPPESSVRDDIVEVERAARRAATLTAQLLAYARRQLIAPTIADPNQLIAGLQPMLRRLLAEDVEVETDLDPGLWSTRIDTGQFDQLLINLAANARDAMPHGGRLAIGTRNRHVSEAEAAAVPELAPGDYVAITVSDTGSGMPPDVVMRVFEPFFTTKPPGQGTGLGLAMCYGIVKQAEGHIEVRSTVGEGSTFTILLPRSRAPSPGAGEGSDSPDAFRGSETVLVVEDDPTVRAMATRTLREAGYRVLEAEHAEAARECSERFDGRIDLMLTDVVMPGMGGADLAQLIATQRPEIRIVYMSGYTHDAVVRRGVRERAQPFLSKPFEPAALAKTVRHVLDGVH